MADRDRIVVTGVGCVAPNGIGSNAFWSALVEGRNALREITAIDVSNHGRHLGGQVIGFDAEKTLGVELANRCGRASQMAIAAGREALAQANLADPPRGGLLVVGTTMADVSEFEKMNDQWFEGGMRAIERANIHRADSSGFAARIGRGLMKGVRPTFISNACAAGNAALALAAQRLRSGDAPFAVAGGSDPISRIAYTGFVRLGAMAPERCQPFDRDRRGMMASEGAGMLVLETLESARRRGATPLAELAGFGMSCDANHVTSPRADGRELAVAIRDALKAAEVRPSEVGYFGAHGTGTAANDLAESHAIRNAFGDCGTTVPVSSIKSMIGHAMGAASALQSIACVMSIQRGAIPPNINYENPDPECGVNIVANKARHVQVDVAVSNASAFGGNNATLVFRRVRP